uniref:P2X purinoreceptor 7 intracellular domain-containing protein n=1 Tax=Knipowitschia caucasica TaxID=637954 RepID=A0AAV2K1X3_KNICA
MGQFEGEHKKSKRLRFVAYRSIVSWCWGQLGARIRVVIPACAVLRIRQDFPDPDGQYVGFLPSGQPRLPLD